MTDDESRPRAVVIRKSRAQLLAERDDLIARIDGCEFEWCPHHHDLRESLGMVRFLLGEDTER